MTIVVGVDGSAAAQKALRWAIGEARIRGSEVRAVYAWDIPASLTAPVPVLGASMLATAGIGFDNPVVLDKLHRSAELRVGEVVDRAAGSAGVERVAVQGHPTDVLVEEARDADLLVVGSKGHGALADVLRGSVGHACAQRSSCPVVIVRAQDDTGDAHAEATIRREAILMEFAQNRETWKALERLGVSEGMKLRLDFLYETGGEGGDRELADHLRDEHGYDVEIEDGGVTGSTDEMPVSPKSLDDWVAWMVTAGHEHGGCTFDGWTATVAAGSHRPQEPVRIVRTAA